LTAFYNKPGYQCHELHFDTAQAGDASARFQIFERISTKKLLLDYGCGSGNMLKAGKARGWSRVVGVEVGENARRRLVNEGFEVYSDLASAGPLHGQVDVLTMIQVFEHLVEPDAALKQVYEMLQPEGLFVVEVPNAASLRARIAGSMFAPLFTRPIQRYQAFPIHLYHFEAPQLVKLLTKNGFKVVEIHTVGMGVEELLPPAPLSGRGHTETPREAAPVATASSLAPGFVKRSIKTAMSRFRLGEQLFLLCRKSPLQTASGKQT